MRKTIFVGLVWCVLWTPLLYAQTTYYVATNGGSVSPYTSWADAATNIHAAVALAGNGDTVMVSNGVFMISSQIVLSAGFTFRSLNGPDMTTVARDAAAGSFSMVAVSNANALMSGLTLTNGTGLAGAIRLVSGTVSNCVITKCTASGYAEANVYLTGGQMTGCIFSNNVSHRGALRVYGGTVEDCTIITNRGSGGGWTAGLNMDAGVVRRCRIIRNSSGGNWVGGVYLTGGRLENSLIYGNGGGSAYGNGIDMEGGVLANCTIAGNSASLGAGSGVYRSGGAITNCIVYGNGYNAPNDNYYGSVAAVWYSCAAELTNAAQGNLTVNPRFVAAGSGDFHLAAGSPCVDAGTNLAGITADIDLRSRPLVGYAGSTARHDMGAYEKDGTNGTLEVGFAGSPLSGLNSVTSVLTAVVSGSNATITAWAWDLDNNGVFDSFGSAVVTNVFGPGRYSISVRVTNSVGETASSTNLDYVFVVSSSIYVSTNGGNVAPYATWADATTNINEAVGMALAGCTIWVSNGSYRVTNQLNMFSGFALRGVNGPDVTTLWRDASFGSFRLFDIRDANALICGLTLTNGISQGAALSMSAGTVSNCIITKCSAATYGEADVYVTGGLLTGCVFSNNVGHAGAVRVSGGVMEDCTVVTNTGAGGGWAGGLYLSAGTTRRCRIIRNKSNGNWVGGVYFSGGRLENSLICGNSGNSSYGNGIKMEGGILVNCTVANNLPSLSAGSGIYQSGGAITNCIVYGNGLNGPNDNYYGTVSAAWYSCAPELTNATQGNVTADPKFVNTANADYRLALGSACMDTGTNLPGVAEDIDRRVRPLAGSGGGAVRDDMGAYEKDGAAGPLDIGFSGTPLSGLGSVQTVFSAFVAGTNTTIAWWGWDFDNNGVFDSVGTGLAVVTNVFGPGRYSVCVRVTNSVGETATSTNLNYVLVVSSNIYVSTTGGSVLPYTSWADAATNVHDAFRVALAGSTVWITNGSYRVTNQLEVFSAFTVRSVNGPEMTTLYRDASFGSFRLFDIRDANALVSGLTLTNGVTLGAAINMTAGTVNNCVITKCTANGYAEASVYLTGGLVTGCVISNNAVNAGAVRIGGGTLEDSTIVTNTSASSAWCGGLYLSSGVARRCRILRNNSGGSWVGGVYFSGGRLENSLIAGNRGGSAYGNGIDMEGGALVNCTVASNSPAAGLGSGVYRTGGGITNSIIYGNGTNGPNDNYYGAASAAWYSCAPELTNSAQGNVTADPKFRDIRILDCHLRGGSPCMNKGITLSGMTSQTDLDGGSRVVGGKVDMGAYEATFLGSVFMIR
jgi:hypothetical protein